MSSETILAPLDDRSLFSMHPEDWVSQRDSQDDQTAYFKTGLRFALPGCFVSHDLAVYWVPGQYRDPYCSPDNFVSRQQPLQDDPTTWLTWEDGPIDLVIEVASDSTRDQEADRRDKTYAVELGIPEYLYVDLPLGELQLYRLVGKRCEPVAPDELDVFRSREFGVGFVRRPGERLVRVLTPEGEVVPTYEEETAQRREAEAAQQEAEARQREAEAQRRQAEARAQALQAELDRLRQAREEGEARTAGPEKADPGTGS